MLLSDMTPMPTSFGQNISAKTQQISVVINTITDIKNHLGHDNIQSTTIYLHLDLNRRRYIQKHFIRYMESVLTDDPKIEELLHWKNEEDMMAYLDRL